MLKGPRRPGWNWFMELGTQVLKGQLAVAFRMRDVHEARRYLDCLVVGSAVPEVNTSEVIQERFRGRWFACKDVETRVTVLYFHGGGYSYYPRAYADFITLITLAAKSRTFALDYRLSPEYRFPAQLEDALLAYRWLLGNATKPENLVVAGDSAGGNLTLALLLAVRDARLPLPAAAIALSPATDFEAAATGMPSDTGVDWIDWIDWQMLKQWADWFCDPAQRRNPLVSPVRADLRGLPPIYIQAGRAEILFDSIQSFADRAREQGTEVVLETWEHMNHDFQIFGPDVPQSAEALRRLGEVVEVRTRGREHTAIASKANL
jgi:acetyl esterase/lipase